MTGMSAEGSNDGPDPARAAGRAAAFIVVLAAGALATLEARPVAELFVRADPVLRGSWTLLGLRPLLALVGHVALIVIGLHRLLARRAVSTGPTGARTTAWICYGLLAFELLLLVPCLFAHDALCGVYYIVASPLTATSMLLGLAVYVSTTRSRALTASAASISLAAVGASVAAYWMVTPGTHAECDQIAEAIARDTCRMNFALAASDADLCETVDFDSSRWSCLYQIAERDGNAVLCDRIAWPCRNTDPGPACDPEFYRDTCLLVVARRLQDATLCGRMAPGELQSRCREQVK